jgi:hypothetical protein
MIVSFGLAIDRVEDLAAVGMEAEVKYSSGIIVAAYIEPHRDMTARRE